MRSRNVLFCFFAILFPATGQASEPAAEFRPDPLSVQRYGSAYRYPQAGWIVLHIEGTPYERGYQHGRLLAPEIAAYVRCSAAIRSATAPADGWSHTRSLVNALFLRRYDREYLEEMKGIADGAASAGARFEQRPIDLVDIACLNGWAEIETLDAALEATPTGLEALRFPHAQPRAMPPEPPAHCSAFAATGPATADGQIVFGHITMFELYPSLFFNVWLDIRPTEGHRLAMQTFPGGIQSAMDYYLNDAGLLVSETTIAQTRFDSRGMTLASRIRHVMQYADSIDQAAEILRKSNNGLYTNEWLLGDIKTNEIAMLELGTARSKLYRSSKKEWYGGTEGFYWGCNNTKDLEVRLETIPGVDAAPANLVWRPTERDRTWRQLFEQNKGHIDESFARRAFTSPPIAAYPSIDAKFTTAAMARQMKTWALFGPPLGRSWQPTDEERKKYAEIRPMISNPWTILQPSAPGSAPAVELADIHDRIKDPSAASNEEREPALEAAWHGTLLPKADKDIWLASAFAEYQKIVSLENSLRALGDGKLSARDHERLSLELFAHRANYAAGCRSLGDVPLARVSADIRADHWYRLASGKGVLLLHDLHRRMGDAAFVDMMESFGKAHAGQTVASEEFAAHAAAFAGGSLDRFLEEWLNQPGLPTVHLGKVTSRHHDERYIVEGTLVVDGTPPGSRVDVTVETAKGEVTRSIVVNNSPTSFTVETRQRPRRVCIEKYTRAGRANGGGVSVLSFLEDLPHVLIVYGTADEAAANREAAETLQREIAHLWTNISVPFKADRDVTQAELASGSVILIGRPDCNRWFSRMRLELPVSFGTRSFTACGRKYAHSGSAVIAVAANPLNPRFGITVLAGLSAESTVRATLGLLRRHQVGGDVLVMPNGERRMMLVSVPADCQVELPASDAQAAGR